MGGGERGSIVSVATDRRGEREHRGSVMDRVNPGTNPRRHQLSLRMQVGGDACGRKKLEWYNFKRGATEPSEIGDH